MKSIIWISTLLFLLSSCKEDSNPVKVDPPNPFAQKEIDWPSLQKAPWPMYRHDPQLTGRSQYIGPSKGIIVDTIIPSGASSLSAISIDNNGRIYCSITGADTNLLCLNITGTPVWALSLSLLKPYNTPTILNDNSIIHIAENGVRKISSSGSVLWKWTPPSNVYEDETLIDKFGNIYCMDNTKTMHKISPSGTLVWSKTDNRFLWGDGPATSFSPDGTTLYVSGSLVNAPRLLAVSAETGEILWTFGEFGVPSAPIVDNNGNIYVLSPVKGIDTLAMVCSITPKGTLRWKSEFRTNRYSTVSFYQIDPTIDNAGNIYFVFHDTLRSFSNEGILRWKQYIGAGRYISTPLICDNEGNTYLGTHQTYGIISFNANGIKRWEIPLNKTLISLTLLSGKLIVTTYFNRFYIIE